MTETQLNALFGLVPIHYKAFFMTLAMTGIRTGEALGLKWADVDFAEREIHVRLAIYRGKETTPKTVSRRSRPMVEKLYRALLNHRAISAYTTQADYVFASSTGHPFNPDQLREALPGALGKLGVQMDQKHVRNAPASEHQWQRCVQTYGRRCEGYARMARTQQLEDYAGHVHAPDERRTTRDCTDVGESRVRAASSTGVDNELKLAWTPLKAPFGAPATP